MSSCKSCHRQILWVVMAGTGKKMPLDPEVSAAGNIVVDDDGTARVDTGPGRAKHLSHFATCPNAARHRVRRP